jgi:tetraprenyl-beta-curcumene synthase
MESDRSVMEGHRRGHRAHRLAERVVLAAVFVAAALSYWLTVFPLVALALRRLRGRAERIADPRLRELALAALAKRGNIEGAAAFAAFVPLRRRATVVRALVAFQAAYNYADMLAEQPCADPSGNARRLHEALLVALEPGAPHRDYYSDHPQRDDDGYLSELIDTCRRALHRLPSYAAVAEPARRSAARIVEFQSLSLDPERDALAHWARADTPAGSGLQWWETAASGGSSMGVHVLIASAAARRAVDPARGAAVEHAYFPWIGSLHSLLDSLVDRDEDAGNGQFSLLGCYASTEDAAARMGWIAAQAARSARALPRGRRHLVILAGMAGYYLADSEASAPGAQPIASAVLQAIGPLAGPTLLVFRIRRLVERVTRSLGRGRPGAVKDTSISVAKDKPLVVGPREGSS